MNTDLDNLPDDVEALRAALRQAEIRNAELDSRNAQLETINKHLAELVAYYKRLKFGRLSEKLHPDQLKLALEDVFDLAPAFEDGSIAPPRFLPPWARRANGLAGLLAFSLFANTIRLDRVDLGRQDAMPALFDVPEPAARDAPR